MSNGQNKHQQAAAYILMLNTGARPGEILAVNNKDMEYSNQTAVSKPSAQNKWQTYSGIQHHR